MTGHPAAITKSNDDSIRGLSRCVASTCHSTRDRSVNLLIATNGTCCNALRVRPGAAGALSNWATDAPPHFLWNEASGVRGRCARESSPGRVALAFQMQRSQCA